MEHEEKNYPLATEMYEDLKRANKFKEKLIFILLAGIGVLILALAGTNFYHIYQWSQFETVVVETGEGEGNANYVQGDNSGGIYNGESSGASQEKQLQDESKGSKN